MFSAYEGRELLLNQAIESCLRPLLAPSSKERIVSWLEENILHDFDVSLEGISLLLSFLSIRINVLDVDEIVVHPAPLEIIDFASFDVEFESSVVDEDRCS